MQIVEWGVPAGFRFPPITGQRTLMIAGHAVTRAVSPTTMPDYSTDFSWLAHGTAFSVRAQHGGPLTARTERDVEHMIASMQGQGE